MQPIHWNRAVLRQFAELLEYPTVKLAVQSAECARQLKGFCPPAGEGVAALHDLARRQPLQSLEELYTRTFELHAQCYPYLGYHLFGDSYQRGVFLSKLNGLYRQHGFSAGSELADHLSVVLRFLAQATEDDETAALFTEGLTPAVGKMTARFNGDGNPYGGVLSALQLVLTHLTEDRSQ